MSTHRINVSTTHAHHWSYSINGNTETHVAAGVSSADVTLEDGNTTITVKAYGSGNEYLNASDTSVVAYSSCTPAAEAQATVGYSHYPGYRQQKFGGHGGKRYVFGAYANGGVGIDHTNLWAIDYLGVWRHLPSQTGMSDGSYGVPQAGIGVIMGKASAKNNTYEQRVAAFSTGIFITQGPVTRWNNYSGPRGWDGYVYVGGKDGQQVAIRPTDAQIQTASQIEICTGNENATVPNQSVTANVTTNVLCHGGSTGAVSCTPGGGAGGYEYVWRNSSDEEVGTTQNVTGLPSGEYTVEVTDSEFASVESSVITITQPGAALTITSVDVT